MQPGTVHVKFDVPAELVGPEADERARRLFLLDAIREERISWRRAAHELGIGLDALVDLARHHGVPLVRYEMEDYRQDLQTLERLERQSGVPRR